MREERVDKITKYWITHAEYDLETAKAMYKSRRYLYVTFMCQQAIEKLLKGLITSISSLTPPRTHNLVRLAEIANLANKLEPKQLSLMAELTPFCIESRYADYQEKMSKLTNRKLAAAYLEKTKALFKWLKKTA